VRYSACGAAIHCPCCRNDTFDLDHRQLNTAGMTFLGLDWANRQAAILVCKRCSHIMWFMDDPDKERD
jgi:predicted nucleic-acid-binding Zn-ribbon protein